MKLSNINKILALCFTTVLLISVVGVSFSAVGVEDRSDEISIEEDVERDPVRINNDADLEKQAAEEDRTVDESKYELHLSIVINDWNQLYEIRNNLASSFTLMNDLDENTDGYDDYASENANELVDEGDWEENKEYEKNDLVENHGDHYYCIRAHTADSENEPGEAEDWDYYWAETDKEVGDTLGWDPIGDFIVGEEKYAFRGTFNGNGHEIRGLFINRPEEDNVGLFGCLRDNAVVENVGIVDVDILGRERIGGLVGDNRDGEVINSYSTGKVSGFIAVGGLAGYNRNIIDMSNSQALVYGDTNVIGGLVGVNFQAEILNSYATGEVTAKGYRIGGLVGNNYQSLISNSYATGNVYGGSYNVGGLVGYNYANIHESTTVSYSYATGSVTGGNRVGGLVGENQEYGSISNSYATGSVEGDNRVGGLVGLNNEQAEVEFCYATGFVDCDDRFGGLVGVNEGSVSDSFYDRITTGCDDEGKGKGRATATMMREKTFTDEGWDFENDWWMISGGTRPFLQMEWSTEIRNSHQLQMMQMDLSEDYILGNKIDLTGYLTEKSRMWGTTPTEGAGFQPVGEWTAFPADEFTGSLNGNDYTITGLYINSRSRYIGLFGYLGEGGSVRNVGLEEVDIRGNRDVGSVVGYNGNGTVDNIYATGSIRSNYDGYTRIGGLVGTNRWEAAMVSNSYTDVTVIAEESMIVGGLIGTNILGATVNNSYTTGDVNGNDRVGGLIGNNVGGSIYNSYATGDVIGNEDEVGGLIGYIYSHFEYDNEIHNSYTTGSVTGSDYVGGFIGSFLDKNTKIFNSYSTGEVVGTGSNVGGFCGGGEEDPTNLASNFWDTDTSGKDTGFGGENLDEIDGRNTTDMMTKNTFTAAGWDFDNDWWMVDGQTRPFLQMEWSNEIRNSHQLQMMAMDLKETYELSNDIDFSGYLTDPSRMWGTSPTSGTGFAPVGELDVEDRFTGLLDGQGNTITGMYINDEDLNNVGLIGYMDDGAVNNIGLLDAEVIGRNHVGTIVGYNLDGELSNSYSTGSVSGNVGVGGLLGRIWNGGKVSNSHYNIEDMTINGGNHITVGALFEEQYDDWFSNDLSLDISEYDGTLVPTEGYYEISDIHGLRDILGFAPIHSYEFRLGSNIDLNTESGFFIPYLAADFHGDGYTISNLEIDQDFTSGLGMFGYNRYGLVNNVSLVDVDIIGGIDTGGLVGNNHGTISSSYVTGDIMGTSNVGGILGVNYDSVKDSHTTAKVIGTGQGIGGLVGNNREGSISHSYAAGNVNGAGNFVGGLAGLNYDEISKSRAAGDVEGSDNVGGLVGYENGEIFNSYAHGNVNGSNNVGGLVGYHIGHVEKSYSAGHVSGTGNKIGGLVGNKQFGPIDVIDSFWDNETSGQTNSDGGEGRNTTDMMDNTTFADADWDITDVADINERDEEYIWNIVDTETYPFFSWEATKSTHPLDFDVTAGDGYVELSWEEPEDDGGTPITNYNIYKGTSSGDLDIHTSVSGTTTSYIDNDVTNGVTYYYRVSAVNSAGEGPKTEEESTTPLGTPSAPENFQATADDGYVDLSWEEPDDDGGSSITSYRIYRGTSSGDLEFHDDVDESTLEYIDNDVTNGVTYYYQVYAENDEGIGAMSEERSATPAGAPSAPENLVATPGDSMVELEWSTPDDDGGSMITAYRIYQGTTSGSLSFLEEVEGDTLSYTDTGLRNGQTYFYQVSAVNDVEEGPMSSEESATPLFEPVLTIEIVGEGSTNPSEGTHTYEEDKVVTVEAIPDEGWIFSHWTGDVTGTDAEIQVTMDENKTITVHFVEIDEGMFSLTIEVVGGGSTNPSVGTHTYKEDKVVTVETTPDEGWLFSHWTGDDTGTDAEIQVTMDENKTIIAHFVEIDEEMFYLTIEIVGGGSTDPSEGTHTYGEDEPVDVKATPDEGWLFSHWDGDVPEGEEEQESIDITMDENKTITANFIEGYEVNVGPVVDNAGDPVEGADVELSWEEDGSDTTTTNSDGNAVFTLDFDPSDKDFNYKINHDDLDELVTDTFKGADSDQIQINIGEAPPEEDEEEDEEDEPSETGFLSDHWWILPIIIIAAVVVLVLAMKMGKKGESTQPIPGEQEHQLPYEEPPQEQQPEQPLEQPPEPQEQQPEPEESMEEMESEEFEEEF